MGEWTPGDRLSMRAWAHEQEETLNAQMSIEAKRMDSRTSAQSPWVPTAQLRWYETAISAPKLQVLWRDHVSGATEWRNVPTDYESHRAR